MLAEVEGFLSDLAVEGRGRGVQNQAWAASSCIGGAGVRIVPRPNYHQGGLVPLVA